MFELGLLALRRAVELGLLADCELSLIGPRLPQSAIEVAPDVPLVLEGPYGASRPEGLRRYDVGLALAGTPQPNPLSLEMAASGMVAVVNTCGVRTEDWVRARSPNLLAAEPTIDALASALGRAVERAADVETRVSGAGVDWPTDWSEALTADALERVERLVRACRAPGRGPVAAAVGGTGKAPSA
jgi:hypothetical protein